MTLISTTTVGAGGVSAVTFSSIPATFTDLILVASVRCATAGYNEDALGIRFNGDSTYGNYGFGNLQTSGNGTLTKGLSSMEAQLQIAYVSGGNIAAQFFGTVYLEIPFYTSSSTKAFVSEWALERNATAASNGTHTGRWTGTAAISSLTIVSYFGSTIGQHSMFSLYGRTKGSGGATVS